MVSRLKEVPKLAMATQFVFKRYEKKYLLDPMQYAELSSKLGEYMAADEYGRHTICNIYFDTDDYELIRTSLEKPIYKEKLRLRSYGIPGDNDRVFAEVKKKFDGVVYKRRTAMTAGETERFFNCGIKPRGADGQILREIEWFLLRYQPEPKVFLAYDRMALFGKEDPALRITFDRNIRWRDTDLDLRFGDRGEAVLPPDKILMEIKIPGTVPVWLGHMLSEMGLFPTSFSKYGTCYVQNILGRNVRRGSVNVCA